MRISIMNEIYLRISFTNEISLDNLQKLDLGEEEGGRGVAEAGGEEAGVR